MNITTSYELVIIPATIALGLSVQEPDIGAKNIAITVPIVMAATLIDPVVVAKKNTYPSASVMDIPASIPTPDIYANTFSNPSPFNLSMEILQPTTYTQTNISADLLSISMTIESFTTIAATNFYAANYGTIFGHWNIENTPNVANSSGTWATANAGEPGEEIGTWHDDYNIAGQYSFYSSYPTETPNLKSKIVAGQNGNIIAKYARFSSSDTGYASRFMNGGLTAGTHLGEYMNNRTAINLVFVVEPFSGTAGQNAYYLHCFNSGSVSRLQIGGYYISANTISLSASISRNGAGSQYFTFGPISANNRHIFMVTANFVDGWVAGYVNNYRSYYSSATFGGGSGNTDATNSNKIILGGLWSTGSGSVIYPYFGNLYQMILYKDTSLNDNDREQIFRTLGGYYGITQSTRNY